MPSLWPSRTHITLRTSVELCHGLVPQCVPHFKHQITFMITSTQVILLSLFAQLEAVRPELATTKEDLNKLIGSGKLLTVVLKKLPDESIQSENVTTEMDAIVDRWLDVSAFNAFD